MNSFSWDDARFFLALARFGTLSAAAESLNVSHATVARRVRGMEEVVGGRVFDKTPLGFVLTSLGEDLLEPAEALEAAALRMVRVASSRDENVQGKVRLAVGGFMSLFFSMPLVGELRRVHPKLELELVEGGSLVDLDRQEADLAIRVQMNDFPGHDSLIVRRLGAMRWAFFGNEQLVQETGVDSLEDVEGVPIVCYSASAPAQPDREWLKGRGAPRVVATTNSAVGALGAAIHGVGYAVCPVPLAQTFGLRQVSEVVAASYVFVVAHPDMRRSRRVRAVADFVYRYCAERPDIFVPVT